MMRRHTEQFRKRNFNINSDVVVPNPLEEFPTPILTLSFVVVEERPDDNKRPIPVSDVSVSW